MAKKSVGTPDDSEQPEQSAGRRRSRRATVAGTGPAAADGPEPRLEDVKPQDKPTKKKPLSQRDQWMLEEKPPHY